MKARFKNLIGKEDDHLTDAVDVAYYFLPEAGGRQQTIYYFAKDSRPSNQSNCQSSNSW